MARDEVGTGYYYSPDLTNIHSALSGSQLILCVGLIGFYLCSAELHNNLMLLRVAKEQ